MSGALKSTIAAHGPITPNEVGSATKRIVAQMETEGWVLHRPCPGCCNCAPSNFTDPKCMGDGQLDDQMLRKFHGA